MRRFWIVLALWFFGAAVAAAQTPRANNACAGSVVLTEFATPLYCLNGARYANYDQIPGWGSQGEGGSGHGSYAPDAQGIFHSFGMSSLRVTNLGLLVEQGSINYAPYSNTVGGTSWVTIAASSTTGQSDPFGTAGAAICIANGTSNLHQCYNSGPVTYSANSGYVESLFVKSSGANPATYVQLRAANETGISACANFNIVSGVKGSSTSVLNYGINKYANGWFQVYIAFQTSSSASSGAALAIALASSNTDACAPVNNSSNTVLISQAQLQKGQYPTSPIITQGSSASTLPVFAYITNISNLGAGTLYSKTYSFSNNFTSPPYSVSIDNYLSLNGDQIALIQSSLLGYANFNIQAGAYTNSKNIKSSISNINAVSKLAVSWGSQYSGSGDGASPVQGILSSFPTSTITEIELGGFRQNNYYLNGYVQSAAFFQKPLSGAALQNLTLQGP